MVCVVPDADGKVSLANAEIEGSTQTRSAFADYQCEHRSIFLLRAQLRRRNREVHSDFAERSGFWVARHYLALAYVQKGMQNQATRRVTKIDQGAGKWCDTRVCD